MPTLWIASDNQKKLRELERLLEPLGYALRPLAAAPQPVTIVEDAADFPGNAAIKAITLARAVAAPAVGDDSGLVVDALDGRPGVRSARYAGPGATDRDRIDKLLRELDGVPTTKRSARFVCALCLAAPDGRILLACTGVCEGHITSNPRGQDGFGYDPCFVAGDGLAAPFDEPTTRTFAQLSAGEKDAISHRGKALRQLVDHLRQHPLQ